MQIPSTPVHRAPITGLGAWRRADFSSPADWSYRLQPQTLAEIDRAVGRIREQRKSISTLTAEDFPLPSFTADAATLREDVLRGRGFGVVKGLPIERYTDEEASLIYWGIGSFFGATLPQNVKGDRLYSVRDEGQNISRDYGAVGVRFSKTTSGLNFHTDSAPAFRGNTPDIVCLLALQTAKSGGSTAIVSAQTLHNVILEERPDYLERLYAGYYFDRRAELAPGESPTLLAPIFAYDGALQIRHFPFYIRKAPELTGVPLTAADTAPLEFLDCVAQREELPVTFDMERGDMQFVNNTFILHSRTAYQDYPEPERRRHLVRLWLRS
ncbi:MAG TPA: TauD/TfdA family dioxygenase [Bryobacterales bacterium]|nr:TauD/TfdA family dioxygenase [Bryobacterales bacterium]